VLRFTKLIKEGGLPPGVVDILSRLGPVCGVAMASHMEFRKLAFTGYTRTGGAVKKDAASSNLKNITLELGGKSPLIIFGDADLD
jgi:aldehyde dehydrogenase (NAD+)